MANNCVSQMENTPQNVAGVSNAIDSCLNEMAELEEAIIESSDLKEEMCQKYGKMRKNVLELCHRATQFPPQQNTSLEQVQADLAGAKKIITNLFQLFLSQPTSYVFQDRRPRGLALVIGIEKFQINCGLENREGCKFDVTNFTSCFKSVGYKVQRYDDITSYKLIELMTKTASKTAETDHTDYDSFVFCISTHGKDDYVYFSDGERVDVYELVEMVRECPTLKGKPKLFFIQACRNTETTRSRCRIVQRDSSSLPAASPAPIKNIEVDTAIFWATTYENSAHRDPSEGSWFVMALKDVFQENSHQMSLMSMMYLVADRVAQMEGIDDKTLKEVQQCVATTHQLRGDIYFF